MPARPGSPAPCLPRERRRRRRLDARRSRLTSPTLEVRLLDLSEQGLAVESHESLRVGARYRFTLIHDGAEASFEGVVLWCRLLGTRAGDGGDVLPVYRAGVARRKSAPSARTGSDL